MAAKFVAGVQKVAAGVQNVVVAGVQNVVLVPVGRAWVAFEEGLAENPHPPRNDLIVTGLIGFVAIKAQGDQGFPFRTHPGLFKLSIISLLLYGFASAAEQLLVPVRLRAVACLARVRIKGRICVEANYIWFRQKWNNKSRGFDQAGNRSDALNGISKVSMLNFIY